MAPSNNLQHTYDRNDFNTENFSNKSIEEASIIRVDNAVQLQSFGIQASVIGFGTVTLESERFVCVREKEGVTEDDGTTVLQKGQVAIIELKKGEYDNNSIVPSIQRKQMSADHVMMHPERPIIALRAGRVLQLFDLEKKHKVDSCHVIEDIIYWRWIGPAHIALVTESMVMHWTINQLVLEDNTDAGGGGIGMNNNSSAPRKIFDRHGSLQEHQIVDYKTDSVGRWMLLTGVHVKEGKVHGTMQLFNADRGISQIIEGTTGVFIETFLEKGQGVKFVCFVSCQNEAQALNKVHIVQIDHQPSEAQPSALPKRNTDLNLTLVDDMAIFSVPLPSLDQVAIVTKMGFVHLFDLFTGVQTGVTRVSNDTLFTCCPLLEGEGFVSGMVAINRRGHVLFMRIDKEVLVSQLSQEHPTVALRLASRLQMKGIDDLFIAQFEQLMEMNQGIQAARLAAQLPSLRTQSTIQRLKGVSSSSSSSPPIMVYFQALLDDGKELNEEESLELTKTILNQNKLALLEQWLETRRLTCSEPLGDLVREHDLSMALTIYLECQAHTKVCECFALAGQFGKIRIYAEKTPSSFTPDWSVLLDSALAVDPVKAFDFAQELVHSKHITLEILVDLLGKHDLIQQGTSLLLEEMSGDDPEHASLQTKLLEVNLRLSPSTAEAILNGKLFSHFDYQRIAIVAEEQGLVELALKLAPTRQLQHDFILKHYFESEKGKLSIDYLVRFLNDKKSFDSNWILELLKNLGYPTKLSTCLTENKILTREQVITSQETGNAPINLQLAYIRETGGGLEKTEDHVCQAKYIRLAIKARDMDTLVSILKHPNLNLDFLDEQIKRDIIDTCSIQPWPMMLMFSRIGDELDMIKHLISLSKTGDSNTLPINLQSILKEYLGHFPDRGASLIAALLDAPVDDHGLTSSIVKSLLDERIVNEQLIGELELRNKLDLLEPLLNKKDDHNPLLNTIKLKLAIDKAAAAGDENKDLGLIKTLLQSSTEYNPLQVGECCEAHGLNELAMIAYQRGQNDSCDSALIKLCTTNAQPNVMATLVASLIKRKDLAFWTKAAKALEQEENEENLMPLFTRQTLTQIPKSRDPEEVSIAIKALLGVGWKGHVIEILKKLLFDAPDTPYRTNRSLQNLLLMTTIGHEPGSIQTILDKLAPPGQQPLFDVQTVTQMVLKQGLHKEACIIFKHVGLHSQAIKALLANNEASALEEAWSLAVRAGDRDTWNVLAEALLSKAAQAKTPASIECLKALLLAEGHNNDHSERVIALRQGCTMKEADEEYWATYLEYLRRVQRKKNKESRAMIAGEIIYALTRTHDNDDQLTELVETTLKELGKIDQNSVSQLIKVADELVSHAASSVNSIVGAKCIYMWINDQGKLATCLVHLQDYTGAVEAASKSNAPSVWLGVLEACLSQDQEELASSCAVRLLTKSNNLISLLDSTVHIYGQAGKRSLLIPVLERILQQGSKTITSSTFPVSKLVLNLAKLYAEYQNQELESFLDTHLNQLSRPDTDALMKQLDEQDYAVSTKIKSLLLFHSEQWAKVVQLMVERVQMGEEDALDHDLMARSLLRLNDETLLYQIIQFYASRQAPSQLNSLLMAVQSKLEPGKLISTLSAKDNQTKLVHLIKPFLLDIQAGWQSAQVNETLHQLLLEAGDVEALRECLNKSDRYDHQALLEKLSQHSLQEMRLLVASIKRQARDWQGALQVLLDEHQEADAMALVTESHSRTLAEKFLLHVTELGEEQLFLDCLEHCHTLLRTNLVISLAHKRNWTNQAMPFICQLIKAYEERIDRLEREVGLLKIEREQGMVLNDAPVAQSVDHQIQPIQEQQKLTEAKKNSINRVFFPPQLTQAPTDQSVVNLKQLEKKQ